MLGAAASPDPRGPSSDGVPTTALQFTDIKSGGGSSEQRAAGDPTTTASATGRAVAGASGGGAVLTSMVGMYQHQLRDDAFGTLGGGHCGDQPRLAGGGASSSSTSSVLAPPLAQAHGTGEPRQLFEALVGGGTLLHGAGRGKGGGAVGDLGVLVRWMRELAADPVAPLPAPSEHRPRKRHVLALRRARYLRLEDVADAEELPSFLKKRKFHWDKHKKKGFLNMPTRKSERLAKRMKLMASLLLTQRKKIGVGEHFQAEIPEWTGKPSGKQLSRYQSDPETSKMLGTRIWPPGGEVNKTDIVAVGRGRPESCNCSYPGSFFCRQHHINEARNRLQSELGRAFTIWQFDSMGEEISKLWNRDEQLKFNALEQLIPVMDQKTYWAVASKHFASKPRIDLIKYYLNVFLMRRVLSQCRSSLLEIDSDEDEVEEEEDEDEPEGSGSLQRPQDIQDVKKVS